ncbi:hypothetical protein VB638_09585 [Dolichospermum sp. UHCC 0684]|uniref:Uncharacterized protein n=1 Tax=Dolichospermum flos-aquae CCAP 1403/13F TaxID=315271 RepID=A0A6H2C7L4_DOLFA|nr:MULTISPECIES: hypothetical protein [Nostocales]MBJ7296057.1 hypothetical protein [Dolichospermum sp.]MBO1047904.1 hypothetical protein [Dolichospermum sp. DEX182a]MBO1051272.1 hypothetical protein [Dolichospermum sp. DET73]MBS9389658.1 hypothetical protein [Dolichospermum sp. WA123]MBS9393028.1 hypothetical protein [Dolichospermum sp. OL01]MCE2696167.1 hypothetical protein [Anabaena sp. 49633_E8]MCO5796664.1 hypothetical protein [Dolichospermum sp. OL03]MDJ0503472.1 hypothetical protein 
MDLEAQIQLLIDNAPQDGVTPQIMVSIAPVLIAIAQKLNHYQYFILQNSEQDWVLTTLSNRANPGIEKQVIYAFPTIQDVSLISDDGRDPHLLPTLMDVTQILFQLVALKPVHSIVFIETPGNITNTVEVRRSQLERLIQQRLQEFKGKKIIPPNIA